ncbi:MAG: prohibitin family protein [Bacteroidia bacterium]
MKTQINLLALCLIGMMLTSCAIIRPGEVGMKQTMGKLKPTVYNSGAVSFNPIFTKVVKIPVRTENLEMKLSLPSKDGLNIRSEVSILYHIKSDQAAMIIKDIGPNYEDVLIASVLRSAAADVCSRFMAKDMYTDARGTIEKEIQKHMMDIVAEKGFEIERVLLKSIVLPAGLAQAIETKLESEQLAQQMEFELQRERLEAQRRKIEAEGIRDAQKIIEEGLSKRIIEYQSLEAFKALSQSPNAKLIITNGQTPMLINAQADDTPPVKKSN